MKKQAQIMAIWLPLLTLLMCAVIVGIYFIQDKQVDSSLSSPVGVLNVQEEKVLFEIYEQRLIKEASKQVQAGWGSDAYLDDLREEFINLLVGNENGFLTTRIYIQGDVINISDADKQAFISNTLYPSNSFKMDEDRLIVERQGPIKQIDLKPIKDTKASFSMKMRYDLSKVYSFEQEDLNN
ncbi:MAG: hypothetical protein ACP5D2_04145 [Candidatus Nanoarchaeia archaeon]